MENKHLTAIVTGASRGIGKAVAEYLSKLGYSLLLIARNEKLLSELKTNLKGTHQYAAIDVSDSENIKSIIDEFLIKKGHIDLLFNSAGYVKKGTSALPPEEFDKMLMTNLKGIFNTINAVTPSMKERKKGHIFTMSSYSGKVGRAQLGGYAASKFGVIGFCEALYKELAPFGISVTTICPGLVDTDMTADVNVPRDQMIHVNDIVKTVDYLLSLSPSVSLKEISLQCRKVVVEHETY